jgi:hypothetical protein
VLLVVLPIGVYLSMATDAYIRAGLPMPEAIGGMNLAAHVGRFLDSELSATPEFIPTLQEAARPVLERRPPGLGKIRSWQDLDAYVDYTASEHDTLLGAALLPAATALVPGSDYKKLDRMLMRVGIVSIMADPLAYAQHVAAHYYGMWRDLGRYSPTDLPSTAVYIRSAIAAFDPAVDWSSSPTRG